MREAWPEESILENKLSVGIAFSGGGLRAASCGLGWLQALHRLGYLEKVKYISSISGGSWVHGNETLIFLLD